MFYTAKFWISSGPNVDECKYTVPKCIKKPNYMIIINRNQIEKIKTSLSCQPIARTSNHNFLGVFFDDKLKFDIHINKLCSKVSQSTGIMRCISHLVPVTVLRKRPSGENTGGEKTQRGKIGEEKTGTEKTGHPKIIGMLSKRLSQIMRNTLIWTIIICPVWVS